jgi:hypothetical protein
VSSLALLTVVRSVIVATGESKKSFNETLIGNSQHHAESLSLMLPVSLLVHFTEGLTALCRVKPVGNDAVTWLAEWLLRNNPNKPVVSGPLDDIRVSHSMLHFHVCAKLLFSGV